MDSEVRSSFEQVEVAEDVGGLMVNRHSLKVLLEPFRGSVSIRHPRQLRMRLLHAVHNQGEDAAFVGRTACLVDPLRVM